VVSQPLVWYSSFVVKWYIIEGRKLSEQLSLKIEQTGSVTAIFRSPDQQSLFTVNYLSCAYRCRQCMRNKDDDMSSTAEGLPHFTEDASREDILLLSNSTTAYDAVTDVPTNCSRPEGLPQSNEIRPVARTNPDEITIYDSSDKSTLSRTESRRLTKEP